MIRNRGEKEFMLATMKMSALRFAILSLALCMSPALAQDPSRIEHPEKIGVGTWPIFSQEQMKADVDRLRARWFYTWQVDLNEPSGIFVPMVWGDKDTSRAGAATGDTLLGYNEPDHPTQSSMSVEKALEQWPALLATGKRLGAPAVAGRDFGPGSWLGRFMAGARKQGYRVDFLAVHYYSKDGDEKAMRTYLERIHAAYGLPIWVTEWSLADWSDERRFSARQQAAFLTAGSQMMDDLPFVERYAWFGAYEGLGNWRLRSGLIEADRELTPVGEAFIALTDDAGPAACRAVDSRCEKGAD
jgi:hypothetical protein